MCGSIFRGRIVECGDNTWCEFLALILQNEFIASTIFKMLASAGSSASDWMAQLQPIIQEHGEKLIALAGVCFGVWKWWVYRESILHRRLEKYLTRENKRISTAQRDVIEAINRPGPAGHSAQTLYAVGPLRSILRRRKWEPVLNYTGTEHGAERQLDRALDKIQQRIAHAERALLILRRQQVGAHSIKGAIAAARASNRNNAVKRIELENRALGSFQTVLNIPGHENDVWAKECEAHQLRRLGHLDLALAAYEELEASAANIEDDRSRALTIARSKRYRAEILQARALSTQAGAGSTTAHRLMASESNINPGALTMRAQFRPYSRWDQIEQGEMHYTAAFIAHNLGYVAVERTQLQLAANEYQSTLDRTPSGRIFVSEATKRLRTAALAGKKRVQKALDKTCEYDLEWLIPPDSNPPVSNNPQNDTQPVGAAGGDESVGEASKQDPVNEA